MAAEKPAGCGIAFSASDRQLLLFSGLISLEVVFRKRQKVGDTVEDTKRKKKVKWKKDEVRFFETQRKRRRNSEEIFIFVFFL